MRTNVLLASALAMGAMAKPLDRRYYVVETDVEVETVTVYVTAGAPAPTVESEHHHEHSYNYGHHYSSKAPAAPTPSSSSVYVAPPPASSAPAPISTPVYTPPPASSQAPVSSAAPSSSPVYNGDHPTGTIEATYTTGAEYQAIVAFHHNAARANHGASPLTWDDDLASKAKDNANMCDFTHHVDGYGQNIFTASGGSFNISAAITESWYKGEFNAMLPYFGQKDVPSDVFESVGHLTQILWKGTTKVGCASVDCTGRMTVGGVSSDMSKYTVCNYSPPGNYGGEYGNNVGSPISTSNLGAWTD